MAAALIRMSFTRVSARFAVRSPCLLEGGDPGLAGRGPERGTTGTLTVSSPYIRPESQRSKETGGALHRGHSRAAECARPVNFR